MNKDGIPAEPWAKFAESSIRVAAFLKSSEREFAGLIEFLNHSWEMLDTVRSAAGRLAELTDQSGDTETEQLRQSMLDGCAVFRNFLDEIRSARRQLEDAARQTRGMLGASHHLQSELGPLKYIAFHFHLEGSRLAAEDSASILKVYEELREVLGLMAQAGESQERTLISVVDKLLAASESIERAAAKFSAQAAGSEERIKRDLDLLRESPSDLKEARENAASLGVAADQGIREAVRALQGHDAIRQRVDHILASVAAIGGDDLREPGQVLWLEREQASNVLELVVETGSRIEGGLRGVIGAAQGTNGGDHGGQRRLEQAIGRLAGLSSEVSELLGGEIQIGNFVLGQIEPVRELLTAKSGELEDLARSMKRLALNVLISAENMPEAKGVDVLGAWTSEAAERVLKLSGALNRQFAELGATLQSQVDSIVGAVEHLATQRGGLQTAAPGNSFRSARKVDYEEIDHIGREAKQLGMQAEELVQSLRFADEGRELLEELDATLAGLAEIYPQPEGGLRIMADTAGYTMREQHEVHAKLFGGSFEPQHARLSVAAAGDDYGDNVELF